MGFKAANRKGFPYIMHIVDEPQKFSPSNVLMYTVTDIPQFAVAIARLYTTVALYSLSAFNDITKCIINLLRDIHICLWVSFLGLKFNKFLGDYLQDGSLIMSKKTKY